MNRALGDGDRRVVLPSLPLIYSLSRALARGSPARREGARSTRRRTEGTRPTRCRPDRRTRTRASAAFNASSALYRDGQRPNHLLQLGDLLVVDQRGGIQSKQQSELPAANDVVVRAASKFGQQREGARANPVEEIVARDVLAAVVNRIFVALDSNHVGRLDGRERGQRAVRRTECL